MIASEECPPPLSRIRREWRLQVPHFIIRRDQTSRLGAGPLLKSSFITILVAMRVLPAKMCLLAYAILKERSGMEFDARGKRRRETFLLCCIPFAMNVGLPPSDVPEFGLQAHFCPQKLAYKPLFGGKIDTFLYYFSLLPWSDPE
jgi:hypothetical protein